MDVANDGSLNRHGGSWKDGKTAAEERADEAAEERERLVAAVDIANAACERAESAWQRAYDALAEHDRTHPEEARDV